VNDWKAKWIGPGYTEDSVMRPSPLFRKLINDKKIVSATAYITAHGLYEAQINGQRDQRCLFYTGLDILQ
jgi:alpha-L-rhamnosidase